jgi:allantoate deiminase
MKRKVDGDVVAEALRRIDELALCSDSLPAISRIFQSPAMDRARDVLREWFLAAGLDVSVDQVGNLVGRWSESAGDNGTLVIGSHFDTVPDAGKYDGVAGIVLGLAAVAQIRREGLNLPCNLEIVAFAEEEGARFQTGYLGSTCYGGIFDSALLECTDEQGVTLRDVLTARGTDCDRWMKEQQPRKDLLAYLEAHIEQGPVLDEKAMQLGVVTGIAGQSRAVITFSGKAGHAGTTPMLLRRDALTGAAALITEAEALATRTDGLVATVGTLSLLPGATNVIPGQATLSLDLRHGEDEVRYDTMRRLKQFSEDLADERRLTVEWKDTHDSPAVRCDATIRSELCSIVRDLQGEAPELASGAGHDAAPLSAIAPVGMLFVRCRNGLSHHPEEYASPGDLQAGISAVTEFLRRRAH